MINSCGGYDDGYNAVPCLWGVEPGSLVSQFLQLNDVNALKILDLGAGEGKNASAFAVRGAAVDAIECSTIAIRNGQVAFHQAPITWINADVRQYRFAPKSYDVVVCYGLLHCLGSTSEVIDILERSIKAVRRGGSYLLAVFDSGPHDLSAHPGFVPLLLSHSFYVKSFSNFEIQSASSSILHETHPHNGIPHYHSVTRISARALR